MSAELVIIGSPTANSDLHVGHLAGPCVGADVRVRYLRATGRDVVFATGVDDSHTFVTTAAARLGTTADELAEASWHQIKGTFETMAIGLDGFAPTDDAYRALVYRHVGDLYEAGKFRTRTVPLPYSEATGKFLVEGLVGGDCPTCLADTRGGFCEACGHPIDFGTLLDPYSIIDPGDPVTFRDCEILVFPVEEYRQQLIAHYAARETTMRPHPVALLRELLSRPLPDYPVTYPVERGLPAPFPETPGQTINAWLEGMPQSMYYTAFAQRQLGLDPPSDDDAWRAEHGNRLVVFMGFDPLWVWGVVHVAELMAHEGKYILPDNLVCNEFCDLDNEKFSSSKGHVVWARDLVAEVPRDVVRFYLNLTAPEHARTNFSRDGLDKVGAQRLVDPWNDLATALAKLTAEEGGSGPLPVSAQAPRYAAAMMARFRQCYELETYSLTRAAELVGQNVARLRTHAQRLLAGEGSAGLGDLFLQVRALICCAAPILVDLADEAAKAGDFELHVTPAAFEQSHTTAFAVPRLSMRVV